MSLSKKFCPLLSNISIWAPTTTLLLLPKKEYFVKEKEISNPLKQISWDAQAKRLSRFNLEKWVHFFGPVNGKTKVDSFIGYAAHLGLIRGGTPSGLYC